MKKIYGGFSIIFITLLLISCSERNQYILEGESDHWEAKLKVTVKANDATSKDFIINYKGELNQLADISRLEYSYKSAASSGKSEINFNGKPPQRKSFTHHSGSSGSSFDSEQTVNVTVKWDGNEEKMKLKE
ncbi:MULTISPECIES: hypothetical protein [Halobacillus]|uniref:Lipoprotein n=1 Tax=Halobacillus halophilus (strain ATCC 35676 / DSM 2266 / JCM 20832 / KCTC 3685 / LMG 17431 / NBRC 102448 / NCIMB 2269) TaxID=866895 RepID=I0JL73_HALH3|nr:hypothetical protein [Halobacillus halophilus]ASF39016.1 hypothetical protein CEH05_07775 [Halobacillus halophilus]CCG44893.1 hypothetical protein HBHAL_2547 [Halobacillus halophilus DSM 2266]